MNTPQSQLPVRLRAAREACGLTQAEVAQQLGVTAASISYLESGARRVASVQLAKLARLYGCDVAELLAEDFEPSTTLRELFRSQLGQEARPEVIQAGARCLELARAESWLEARLGVVRPAGLAPCAAAPLPAPETVLQSVLQGESMAAAERQRLGLGNNPLGDLLELIESQGMRTALLELPPGVDGFTLTPPQHGAFLVVNRKQNLARRRFSLAHEYAHVLLDAPSHGLVSWSENRRELKETRAHAFAAAFLMPAEGVRSYIASLGRHPRQSQTEVFDGDRVAEFRLRSDRDTSQVQPADVVHLAQHFGVSPLAAIYRMRNLGMLTPTERDALVELDQRGSLAQLSGLLGFPEPTADRDDSQRPSHRFLALVAEALRRSEISWGRARELAQLAGLCPTRFEQLAEAMNIQSEPPDAVIPVDFV